MRKLIAFVSFMCCVAPAMASSCFQYEPATTEVTGVLKIRTFFGPPGFGESPVTDAREKTPVVVTDKSFCVDGNPSDDLNSESERNQRKLQLVVQSAASWSDIRKLKNKKVKVRGTLSHAITGHHHTDVVMNLDSISSN